MTRFSIVVATLLRGSYAALIASVRRQTFPRSEIELISRADAGNEYIARNRAAAQAHGEWLVFVDDDALLPPDHLARLDSVIRSRPSLVAVSGPVRGNLMGQGYVSLDQRGWWVGVSMAVRRDVFSERPFEETWGMSHIPRGWRADSDLGFSIERRYPGRWTHESELTVDHPGPMGSSFQPDVEDMFFRRWRAEYIERFAPVDPRGQAFLWETQDLTDEERTLVFKCRESLRKVMPGLPEFPGGGS